MKKFFHCRAQLPKSQLVLVRRCFPSFPSAHNLRFFGNDIDYTTTRFCFLVNTGLESGGAAGVWVVCFYFAFSLLLR